MRESWRQLRDSFREPSSVVILLSAAILTVWLWTDVILEPDTAQWWAFVRRWGLDSQSLSRGRIDKLLSYGFVHGNFWHLMTNLILLPLLGQRVVRLVGNKSLLVLMVASLVVGGLCQVLMNHFGRDLLLIGASPIAFAWALAWMGLDPDAKTMGLPFRLLGPVLIFACGALAIAGVMPILQTPMFSSIWVTSHAAHFGGALVGWLWASWWSRRKPVSLEQLQLDRANREDF